MKTTVEIGDELMTRIKQLACERNGPVRSLLGEALRRLIDDCAREGPAPRFTPPPSAAPATRPALRRSRP